MKRKVSILVVLVALVLPVLVGGLFAAGRREVTRENAGSTLYLPLVLSGSMGDGPRTTLVSLASDGTQANHFSNYVSISADGRWVSFASLATNLVPGDTNEAPDVFLHDRQTGQTTRVSVGSGGTQANSVSHAHVISADGRFVAFGSSATNLAANDTNRLADIFLHDRQLGQTTRVNVATEGTQANGNSGIRSLSADGRFVVFSSEANNLVVNDTNEAWDIFVHDRQTGQTTRVSVASNGTQSNDGSSYSVISADGRYVAFVSTANNLVAGDTIGTPDLFLHDRYTGQTTLVSAASTGIRGGARTAPISMSGDGRYIVFHSGGSGIVVHDRQTGQTEVVVSVSNPRGTDVSIFMSADGRYVTFYTPQSNLVEGDTNDASDVFMYDLQADRITRISVASDGTQGNNGSAIGPVSANGRWVAFLSLASNLVVGDRNEQWDIFVHDRGSEVP